MFRAFLKPFLKSTGSSHDSLNLCHCKNTIYGATRRAWGFSKTSYVFLIYVYSLQRPHLFPIQFESVYRISNTFPYESPIDGLDLYAGTLIKPGEKSAGSPAAKNIKNKGIPGYICGGFLQWQYVCVDLYFRHVKVFRFFGLNGMVSGMHSRLGSPHDSSS